MDMDKKKNDFLFIIIFIVITILSLLYLGTSSYAKYKRKVNAEIQNRISNWNIKVNNELIIKKTTLSNKIKPTLEKNEYIKEGTLAPGTTGYFDIVINAEDVDVDFTYKISGETSKDTPLLDLQITDYEVNGVKNSYGENKTLTGEMKKNTGDTTIRIYFKWNDDENNIMNNKEDTLYAAHAANKDTIINLSILFEQKNG